MNIKISSKLLKRLKKIRKLIKRNKTDGKVFKKFKKKCKTIPGLIEQIIQNEVGPWEWRYDDKARKIRREKFLKLKKKKRKK